MARRWFLAALLGVAGSATALLKSWPWLLAVAMILAAVVAPWGKLLESRLKRDDDRRAALMSAALCRRVRDYQNPRDLGVHRAVPPYVPRDEDTHLAELLEQGAFILVLGDSAAGKTRFAFEGLKSTLPGHRLMAPDRAALPAAVDELACLRDAVLWLDDLENYLGPNGLTTTMVTRLHGDGRSILATLRIRELKRMEEDASDHFLSEDRRKVLALAEIVNLSRQFTESELTRARAQATDPLIAEALSHTDKYGLAEYLAAGPQLLDRWTRGWSPRTNPRGAALVQAAIDCRRAGYFCPLPKPLLNEIHAHYLKAPRLYPETLDDAWIWVTTPWHDTTALLEETSTGAVTVFDYLVDHVQRFLPDDHPVPAIVLRHAIRHAETADLDRLSYTAYCQRQHALAREGANRVLTRHTRTLGPEHPDTMVSRHNVAFIMIAQGKLAEATHELDAVCAFSDRELGPEHPDALISHDNYAKALILQGRYDEAIADLRATLHTAERTWGQEHRCTRLSRGTLATSMANVGKPSEAANHYRELLRVEERLSGPEHHMTLMIRTNLAQVLEDMRKNREAIAEYRDIARIMRRVHGPDHPHTFMSQERLEGALARAQLLADLGYL